MRTLMAVVLCFALLPLWPTERERVELRQRHFPSGALMEEAEALILPGEKPSYHGTCRRFSEDGNLLSEGSYDHGNMTGLWLWYTESAVVLAGGEYVDGFCPEVTFFNSDGSMLSHGPKQGNQRTGMWTEWYRSGRVHLRGEYVADQMHGLWTFWTDTEPAQQVTATFDHGEQLP